MSAQLAGLVILEQPGGVATRYCGKLFAAHGATVLQSGAPEAAGVGYGDAASEAYAAWLDHGKQRGGSDRQVFGNSDLVIAGQSAARGGIVFDRNNSECTSYIEFAKKLGADGITFQLLDRTLQIRGKVGKFFQRHWFSDPEAAKASIDEIAGRYEPDPFLLLCPNDLHWMKTYIDHPLSLPDAVCGAHERHLVVDMHGDVQLCTYMTTLSGGRLLGQRSRDAAPGHPGFGVCRRHAPFDGRVHEILRDAQLQSEGRSVKLGVAGMTAEGVSVLIVSNRSTSLLLEAIRSIDNQDFSGPIHVAIVGDNPKWCPDDLPRSLRSGTPIDSFCVSSSENFRASPAPRRGARSSTASPSSAGRRTQLANEARSVRLG